MKHWLSGKLPRVGTGMTRAILVFSALVLVVNLVREPLLRPETKTVRSWLDRQPMITERGSDSTQFVSAAIVGRKIEQLTHESGTVYRGMMGHTYARARYSFAYPTSRGPRRFHADFSYTVTLGWSGLTRELISVIVSGPTSD